MSRSVTQISQQPSAPVRANVACFLLCSGDGVPAAKKIPDLFGRATAILGDHSELRESVARLEELCSRPVEDMDAELELSRLFAAFREQLARHFRAEESQEYFGLLEHDAPELCAVIERLRSEHTEMLGELDGIWAAMSDGVAGGSAVSERIVVLVRRLRAHERAENELIAEYFEHGEP